jgi:hypothetical protein
LTIEAISEVFRAFSLVSLDELQVDSVFGLQVEGCLGEVDRILGLAVGSDGVLGQDRSDTGLDLSQSKLHAEADSWPSAERQLKDFKFKALTVINHRLT